MGKVVHEEAHLEIDSATLGMEKADIVEELRRRLEALGLEVEVHIPEEKEE